MAKDSDRQAAIAVWQQRLEDEFQGNILVHLQQMETQSAAHFTSTFRGYQTLSNSFFEFFGISILNAVKSIPETGWPIDKPNFAGTLIKFIGIFRRMRAAELIATQGYPVDGYILLRNVRDEAFSMLALVLGLTSMQEIIRYRPIGDDSKEAKKAHRLRQEREGELRDLLIGRKSGLSNEAVDSLQHRDRLFNQEVHGSRLSFVMELDRWIGPDKPLFTLGPEPSADGPALYMNRSSELAWLLVRMLPYLQLGDGRFGSTWWTKFELLESSHRFLVTGLDKPIAQHFETLLDAKIPMGAIREYVERG